MLLFTLSTVSAEDNITDLNSDVELLKTDSSSGNFGDLNDTITISSDNLSLEKDYIYDSESDSNFTSGVYLISYWMEKDIILMGITKKDLY